MTLQLGSNELSVIVPLLNELPLVQKNLASWIKITSLPRVRLVISDSGSTDGTIEYLSQFLQSQQMPMFSLVLKEYLGSPSVGRTIQQCLNQTSSQIRMVLPADVEITADQIELILQKAKMPSFWGYFKKRFSRDGINYRILELILNELRSKFLHQAVWTNVLFWTSDLDAHLPQESFLEDVIFCDRLNRFCSPIKIDSKVLVSTRRYEKDGFFYRFFSNAWILFRFRFFRVSPAQLKKIYLK